jgi:hypothetical protein
MTAAEAKRRISRAFGKAFGPGAAQAGGLLALGDVLGKLYEAYVLAAIARDLRTKEGLTATLSTGTKLCLKTGGGPINRTYPHIDIQYQGTTVAELWTDVFVTTMSWARRGRPTPCQACDYHELDVVMVPPDTTGLAAHDCVLIAVECKATSYEKHLLRQILGVRRELSLLRDGVATSFCSWPRAYVPALPPSCLMVYSTDPAVSQWGPAGDAFGIDFVHCPIV